jgi:hypothetical protein
MSSVILTHHIQWRMRPLYKCNQVIEITETHLLIEVTFDKTYTLMFHEFIPRSCGFDVGTRQPIYDEKKRYIRDIPYFPDTILDAIKLMSVIGDNSPAGPNTYIAACPSPLFNLRHYSSSYNNPPRSGDSLFNYLSEIFAKIKTEHEKKQIDDMKTSEETAVEQRKINEKLSDDLKMSEAIAIVQHNINEKLTDDLKTSEETVAELRKINERLAILIDGEKLKKSLLSKKLSDITDLYKVLLSTTACKQGQ